MFKDTLSKIRQSAENLDKGLINNIPFASFPKLASHVPGIVKGLYYIVTASSGIGKTQFTKRLFVLEPYMFVKECKSDVKLKIMYFALEESKEEFMLGLISNRLAMVYNIHVSVIELQSFTDRLDQNIIDKIEECQEYFEDFEKYVEVIDTVYNPTGLYKHVREYADRNGTHHFRDVEYGGKVHKIYDYYEPDDPNEFVIVITDHVSLLQEEKDRETGHMMNKHQTISKWSADYCRKQISKNFGYTVVNVQQQAAEKEKQEFYRGNSVEAKLEPSLDGLADNKLTQRDAFVVLALYAPDRYEIKRHLKYDTSILGDNYRALKVLKNRLGRPNLKAGLFFDGKVNEFMELPPPNSSEIENFYNREKS